ncbi:ISKra4 family transposase [Frankia sp. Cppng1_Ct_nod]|uniref:ISKra4 family transposase n=1 Tax=Frankia sp. Cppng1_Ct_nod TaxID=2897162 RepID=UPI001041985D|nr:ISKra4 family transposase [Frankia sp. Cppng1_Ct_nod]
MAAGAFAAARERYFALEAELLSDCAQGSTVDSVEDLVNAGGRELLLAMLQAFLDVRAQRERRAEAAPVGADGAARTRVEKDHSRKLISRFGPVRIQRMAYRAPNAANLHLADLELNLPTGAHSHTLRREVTAEATRGSFDDAVAAVERATGQKIGKRQAVELARSAATDVAAFYAQPRLEVASAGRILVLQFDGKGIMMRPEGLRPATAKAAQARRNRLSTRLSPGEKSNRKRMAEIAVVHDATPAPRAVDDVLPLPGRVNAQAGGPARARGPKATGKWLTASVVDDIATVIAAGFDEAERRDPHHQRTWVVLVDGNNTQIDAIQAEAARRRVTVHVLVDFVHVTEYVWTAAWSFFETGDPHAETWVRTQLRQILRGKAPAVAAGIGRRATNNHYNAQERRGADTVAAYLKAKAPYLGYGTALANGWPIATGVVEGTCRFMIKDRFDITGARWGLEGAESLLLLRAVVTNGDFDAYWAYHLDQEQQRNHYSKLAPLDTAA